MWCLLSPPKKVLPKLKIPPEALPQYSCHFACFAQFA